MRKGLKIRSRLILSFFVIATIGGAMGGMGMYYMGLLSRQTSRMLEETSAPLTRVIGLYSSVMEVQVYARDFLLKKGSELDATLTAFEEKSASIESETAALIEDTADGELKTHLESFQRTWGEFKASLVFLTFGLQTASEEGRAQETVDFMYNLLGSKGQELRDTMTRIVDGYMTRASGMAETSQILLRRSAFLLLTLVVAGFAISIVLGVIMAGSLAKPLRMAATSASIIARGDLTATVDERSRDRPDEVGDMARALKEMVVGLNAGMMTIRGSVNELGDTGRGLSESLGRTAAAVTQIGAGIESVTNQMTTQGAGVEETAATVKEMARVIEELDRQIGSQAEGVATSSASVEEMVGNIRSVAASVERLSGSFVNLLSAAEDGKSKLDRVNDLIRGIAAQSDKLQEANSAVSAIASKTNLLAMNAAIESAHAGEAGKGFAVVADEIRNLAESATTQSKEISTDIGSIRHSIDEVVSGAATAQEAFASVQALISSVSTLEQEINVALEEQREGSRQVLESLAAIKDVSAAVRSGSNELHEGSRAIDTEMGELQTVTNVLREAVRDISQSREEIADATSAVAALSERNRSAIGALESMLTRYVLDETETPRPSPES